MTVQTVNNSITFGIGYNKLSKYLKKQGCYILRQSKGSHVIWQGQNGAIKTIANHGKTDIKANYLRDIFKRFEIENPFIGSVKNKNVNVII